jgi:hypothetical protein
MFSCEAIAGQSTYILLNLMQKKHNFGRFVPCFLLYLPFFRFKKIFKTKFSYINIRLIKLNVTKDVKRLENAFKTKKWQKKQKTIRIL